MSVAARVWPTNGFRPASAQYKMTPIAQMSVRASTCAAPSVCSGDMYSGVPMSTPMPVLPAFSPSVNFEMPKSMSLTSRRPGSGSCKKMFSGLRSRWTMPLACAAASPISACRTIITTTPGSTRPARFTMKSAKSEPSSISMTM